MNEVNYIPGTPGWLKLAASDRLSLLSTMPDNYFDIVIIDPEYGIGEDGRKHDSRWYDKVDKRTGRTMRFAKGNYDINVDYDSSQPPQEYFDEIFRVSKRHIIWGCNYINFDQKNTSSGRIIWDKVNGDCDQSDCEIAWTNLFSSVRQIEYMWQGMMQGKSIKHGRRQQGDKKLNEKRRHPNHKPSILYREMMRRWVEHDWKVGDFGIGSGSIVIAAYHHGVKELIGCDQHKPYIDGAIQWLNEVMANTLIPFPE